MVKLWGKSEETALQELKEQNSKIKEFLDGLEGGPSLNPFRRREEPLDDLLSFCYSALENISKYRHRLGQYSAKVEELDNGLEDVNGRLIALAQERERLFRKLEEADQEHAKSLSVLTLEHEKEINNMNSKFNKIVQKMKDDRSHMVKEHSAEKDKLITQLFTSHGDTKEWPDEKLKLNYRELQRLIQSLAVTKEFRLQPGQTLPSRWDTYDFMSRITVKGTSHFLLRSIIWRIIMDQYFSAPFGFGALGPGRGKEELNRCFTAWQQLIKGESSSEIDYSIFQQPFANSWRQATFQSIAAVWGSNSTSHSLSQIAKDNLRQTISKIKNLLEDVTKVAGNTIPGSILAESGDIEQLVNLAAEIALQFGIHSSQLKLIAPSYGETVVIGEEYHHCQNADMEKNQPKVVDLVTLPGFVKAGGYKNQTQEYFFVPCEIYYST